MLMFLSKLWSFFPELKTLENVRRSDSSPRVPLFLVSYAHCSVKCNYIFAYLDECFSYKKCFFS